MSKATSGRVNAELQKALADEINEIRSKHSAGEKKGEFKYDLLDRMRVYDRALKLEGIRLKVSDENYGSKFGKGDDE